MSARVLVVESVPADARRMKARLTSGSFHLMGAGTGGEALHIAAEWQPDVVLLAAAMPDMAGGEICRRLKEDPATEGALVVMVADSVDPALELSELAIGADDFLAKPSELAFLPWRMRRLVRFKRARDEYWARAKTARELGLAPVPDPPPTLQGARAAIVDSRNPEAALAQEWLARDAVQGVIAPDAAEPRSTPVDGGFDLILLDLAAIERERGGAPHWLREEERNRRAPLLLIGGPEDPTSTAGYGGVDDWVARPISEARLRARARIQILHRRYQARLHAGHEAGKARNGIDASDGAFDARYAERHLRRLLGGAAMRDLAVLLIEVDRSSRLREGDRQIEVDRSLRAVGATLRENLRVFDTLARYGDTRFVVLMPGAAPAEALNVGERLRDAIAVASFPSSDEDSARRLTVSIGIGAGTGARSSADALLAHAEDALRRAEGAGRNRVELGEGE